MQSNKNYLIYQVLDRARLVPCTREQAETRAEQNRALINIIDGLRSDTSGFKCKNYIPIYTYGDDNNGNNTIN